MYGCCDRTAPRPFVAADLPGSVDETLFPE